jgi:5-methylcytosine-specific restriction endonuclease McrA
MKKLTKIKKALSKTKVKNKFDAIFSKFIRERDKGRCVTCGKQAEPKEMQCGHYISRSNMNTRWDEQNCHCQCVGCNVFKNGNMDEYSLFMISKYGEGILQEMNKRKQQIRQWTSKEIEEKIAYYKEKLEEIKKNY